MKKRLKISFSGGETSAYMTKWCLDHLYNFYDEIVIIFANTGQEREETLEFVEECSKHFGFQTIWVEAITHHNERKAPTHKIVNFETASRNGEPFRDVIKKYGIPNQAFPKCTDNLKLAPMNSYLKSIGWKTGTYDTAIGIRSDEIDRVNKHYEKLRIIYPLVNLQPMTKPRINEFWKSQPFRLRLKGYEGNCSWCWKKSLRKHLTLISEKPELYDFPEEMEKLFSYTGPEFRDPKKRKGLKAGYKRTFFRRNMNTSDLKEIAAQGNFTMADDDHIVYPERSLFGMDLDKSLGGCSEHCEIMHDNGED